jgi:hypothetical protein
MSDVSNLRDTIIPKSDQLNAEQLLSEPMTITVTGVRRGADDQPVVINYEGDDGRPYKPCKTCRKILIFAWGDDGREWVGRSMTLFNNPEIKFGGVKVGGIRISHMSHIDREIGISLTATKGKKEPVIIKKLAAPAKKQEPITCTLDGVLRAIAAATTPEAMDAAKDAAAKLPDADKPTAREAYSLRLAALKAEATKTENQQ